MTKEPFKLSEKDLFIQDLMNLPVDENGLLLPTIGHEALYAIADLAESFAKRYAVSKLEDVNKHISEKEQKTYAISLRFDPPAYFGMIHKIVIQAIKEINHE